MARVLIVDDSVAMRRNLRTLVSRLGHRVVGEASNGEEALVEFMYHKPDLVTMDITMPVMDGITSVKNIVEKFPNAKIIMISAHGQEKLVYDAVRSGAKHYLLKPIKIEKLNEVIDMVMGM